MCDIVVVGTRERNIPYPTGNPFTFLFNFVSCPNYTYEVKVVVVIVVVVVAAVVVFPMVDSLCLLSPLTIFNTDCVMVGVLSDGSIFTRYGIN